MIFKYEIKTKREDIINIDRYLRDALEQSNLPNGIAIIYCPHTTAAITINENADPDVLRDLLYSFTHYFPDLKEYRHFEGNSSAHLKSSLVGVSETVIIRNHRPILGTWQSIYFCEFDGPRNRTFYIDLIETN